VRAIEPRRNPDALLTGWMSLPASFRTENELLVVGMAGGNCDKL
jgi:hypothetical protein